MFRTLRPSLRRTIRGTDPFWSFFSVCVAMPMIDALYGHSGPIALRRASPLPVLREDATGWRECGEREARLANARDFALCPACEREKIPILVREEVNMIVLDLCERDGPVIAAMYWRYVVGARGFGVFRDAAQARRHRVMRDHLEAAYRAGQGARPWSATGLMVAPLEEVIVERVSFEHGRGVHPCLIDAWVWWSWIGHVGADHDSRTRLMLAMFWVWGRLGEPLRTPVERRERDWLVHAESRTSDSDLLPLVRHMTFSRERGVDFACRVHDAMDRDSRARVHHLDGFTTTRTLSGRWVYRADLPWTGGTFPLVQGYLYCAMMRWVIPAKHVVLDLYEDLRLFFVWLPEVTPAARRRRR